VPLILLTPPALLLVALALRLVPGGRTDEAPWSWWLDGLLTVAAAVVLAASCWRLGLFHVRTGYSVADFPEHCSTMAAGILGQLQHWTRNRTLLVGWPAVLAGRRVGVIDGLIAGSVVGALLTGAGLYVWGRALHGRLAGVAAALLAGAVAPLTLLPRTLSFYPMIAGLLVVSCALASVAVRWRRHLVALLLGGVGVGLALLVDVRGFVWACALLPAVAGVALLDRPTRVPVRLLAVLLPLWASYQLGPKLVTPDHAPLEVQANVVRMLRERNDPAAARWVNWQPQTGFVWGLSDLRDLPETVRTLRWYHDVAASRSQREPDEEMRLEQQIEPWLPVLAVAGIIGLAGLLRQPLRLLAALATLAPFVAAFEGAIGIEQVHQRFLTSSMPFVPLVLGLAVAALVEGPLRGASAMRAQPGAPPRRRRHRAWRFLVASVVLELMVLGAIPSWLSPVAPWRRTMLHEDGGFQRLWTEMMTGHVSPSSQPCTLQLARDLQAGRPRFVVPADGQGNPLPR